MQPLLAYPDDSSSKDAIISQLYDKIFEGLPNDNTKIWPERFMSAFIPGRDYSRVGWQFLHWILTDPEINPGIDNPLVRDAIKQCSDVIHTLAKTYPTNAASAALIAANAAERAAWNARHEGAAWSASSAVNAICATLNTESAACAEWSVASAAWSKAESKAESAGSTVSSAWSEAERAAYITMADKLIELIEATP